VLLVAVVAVSASPARRGGGGGAGVPSSPRWRWRWRSRSVADLVVAVTHTRKSRSAFDGYNRGLQWERTCAEVLKLRITRGGRNSAGEQPIAAGSEGDSLQFAAVF